MSNSSGAWKPSSVSSNALEAITRFSETPVLAAIRSALPIAFGCLLVALVIGIFALPAPSNAWTFADLSVRVAGALLPALAVAGVGLVVALAIALARNLDVAMPALVSVSVIAFALSIPREDGVSLVMRVHHLGSVSLFLAMAVDLCCVACFVALGRIIANRGVATGVAWVIAVALFATLYLTRLSPAIALMALLAPLSSVGDSYVGLLIVVAAQTLLWAFGLHGPALLSAIVTPIYLQMQQQNSAAFVAHQPLPHIVTTSLFLFIFPGGAGATLPLAAALLISRQKRLRTLGRAAILPSLVNINEPLILGLPIVLDPILCIPFVLSPVVLATVTYFAVAHGFVARPELYMPSSLPTPIGAWLATNDPRSLVLVLVNVGLSAILYLPFLRAYERREAHR
ncbi:MAG: PTS transporter subunit EIIC [Vulcanimicrobiaceae bacterium]